MRGVLGMQKQIKTQSGKLLRAPRRSLFRYVILSVVPFSPVTLLALQSRARAPFEREKKDAGTKLKKDRILVMEGGRGWPPWRLSPGNGAPSIVADSQSIRPVMLVLTHAPRPTGREGVQYGEREAEGVRSTCLYQLELAGAKIPPTSSCTEYV
jgi:hypothetical protein